MVKGLLVRIIPRDHQWPPTEVLRPSFWNANTSTFISPFHTHMDIIWLSTENNSKNTALWLPSSKSASLPLLHACLGHTFTEGPSSLPLTPATEADANRYTLLSPDTSWAQNTLRMRPWLLTASGASGGGRMTYIRTLSHSLPSSHMCTSRMQLQTQHPPPSCRLLIPSPRDTFFYLFLLILMSIFPNNRFNWLFRFINFKCYPLTWR